MRRAVSLVLVIVAIAAATWLGYHDRHSGNQDQRASSPVQMSLSGVTGVFRGGLKPLSYGGRLMP